MQIEKEIVSWLNNLSILSPAQNNMIKPIQSKGSSSQAQITNALQQQFENGIIFGKLALILINITSKAKVNNNVQIDIQQLKDLNSPAAKLFNWTKLQDIFKKHLQIILDQDLKSLIIAGDTQMMNDFLKEIHSMYAQSSLKSPRVNTNSSQLLDNKSKHHKSKQTIVHDHADTLSHKNKEVIQINNFDTSKNIEDSECLLEFLLLLLIKHLSLKPKQAMTLLTNSGKYLAHILVKGVKGAFEPVLAFYQDCYQYSSTITSLFQLDLSKASLNSFLTIIVPGVLSKSQEVSLWTSNLLQKVALESSKVNLFTDCTQWFFYPNQGFSCLLLGIQRHPLLTTPLLSTLLTYGRYNHFEMLTVLLDQQIPDPIQYLYQIRTLIKALKESTLSDNEQQEVLAEWLIHCLNLLKDSDYLLHDPSQTIPPPLLAITLSTLSDLWMLFPSLIQHEDTIANIIRSLKAAASSSHQPLAITSLTLMFNLLHSFGKSHSPYAPYIYKTLTIILIENYPTVSIRHYILSQFKSIFQLVEGIPLAILVEPYLKTISSQDQSHFQTLNSFDLDFILFLAQSSKLQLKNAVAFLELLAKVYYHSVPQAALSGTALLSIIMRNQQQEVVQQFSIKFVKVGLAMFFASERKKKLKEKQLLPMYNARSNHEQATPQLSSHELDMEMINAQKRSLIVEIIKQIIKLGEKNVNEKVKALTAHTNIQLKQQGNKKNNKAMISLLNEFGDGEAIAREYDNEYQEQQRKEIEMQQMINNRQSDVQSMPTQHTQNDQNYNENNINQSQHKGLLHNKSQQHVVDLPEQQHHTVSLIQPAGVGQQGVSQRITREEQAILQKKLNKYSDPKVRRQLNEMYDQKRSREDLKRQLVDQEKNKSERIQQILRSKLEKRSQEQGINIPIRGHSGRKEESQRVLLYCLNSKKEPSKPQMNIIIVEQQETGEQHLIESTFKQYHKLMNSLFISFAATGFSIKNKVATFDQLKQRVAVINFNELYALLKEYNFSHKVSLEEVKSLTRLINQSIQRKEIENLLQDSFKTFLLQLAIHTYPELCNWPLVYPLQALIDHFRSATKAKGQSTLLYDDPNGIHKGDKDIIDKMNLELQKDSNYTLPEGYKVHSEKKYQLGWSVPERLFEQIGEGQTVAYGVLQDVIKTFMDVQVGEYTVNNVVENTAIPIKLLPQKRTQPKDNSQTVDIIKKDLINKGANQLKYEFNQQLNEQLAKEEQKKKQQLLQSKKNKLSLKSRLAIKQMNEGDRKIAEEVAYVLEDLLQAVEKGKSKVFKLGQYENMYKQQQKEKEKNEEILRQKQDEEFKLKRQKRGKILKKFREQRDCNISLSQQLLLEQKQEKQKLKDQNVYKGIRVIPEFEFVKKENKIKKKLLKIQPKKLVRQEEENIQKKKLQRRELKEKRKQKWIKRKADMRPFIDKEIGKFDEKIKEDEEEKNLQIALAEEKKKREEDKLKAQKQVWVPKEIQANNDKIKLNLENNQKIQDYFDLPEIQSFFKQYEKQFQTIFRIYVQKEYTPLNINGERNTLSLHSFLKFQNDFQICKPNLFNHNQFYQIFNSIIKSKPQEDKVTEGFTFKEFLQSLIRIVIKVDNVMGLDNIPEEEQLEEQLEDNKKVTMNKSLLNNNKISTFKYSLVDIQKRNKKQFDHYHHIDRFDVSQLETLYQYFKLPDGTPHEIEKAILNKPNQPKLYNRTQMNLQDKKNGSNLNQNLNQKSKSKFSSNQQIDNVSLNQSRFG